METAVTPTAPRHTACASPAIGRIASALLLSASAAALLGACSHRPLQPYNTQNDLPATVRVPPGHKAVLEARSSGNLLYECQAVKRAPYEYAWLMRNSSVALVDTYGATILHKPGARATWEHRDGSSARAREFVEVVNGEHSLTLQRYTAESSGVPGMLQNISYVQRLRTVGGWMSVTPCSSALLGRRVSVPYEADFVFWRPAGA